MLLTQNTNGNYTTRQLKLPLEIEKLIDLADPVYTFCEVMDHVDLSRYFVEKDYKTGCPRCDVINYWRMAHVLNQIFSNKVIAKLGYTSMLDYYLVVCEN